MKVVYWFIILLLISSCSTPKVIKYLNDELDYSQYHTYRLINYKSDDKSYSQEGLAFFTQVEEAITQNMTAKGYEKANKPDLIARYEIISTTASSSNSNNNYYDPYSYYQPYYAPTFYETSKFTEGVILIELRDRKQKKLVWQGSLDLKYTKRIEAHLAILESINKIFKTYPYLAGANEAQPEQ
ncbi:DUF4136 domain-containing protein [Reichenbachiella carrageenanivorans]|uniref:DUF4136 domain-containing protein n=1 Tax=Reichenbachiella carrageenanivorans TaxID=2979869 RepID=A0ABY6CZ03_9BACT|nr:DUF4136 domain-containing protein [Reichenbachiella carrageenanivorans]UXX78939.1 DUF4136 domain-containing protein [Reichenbachiella carrageenanivorans]